MSITIYCVLQLVLLVFWAIPNAYATVASVPATSTTFMASIVLFFLSYLEHTRSVRPSTILSLYLSLTVILDIAQLRSLWLQLGPQGITGIFTASFVAKLVVLILGATNKRSTLRPI